jgi:hypothetical protein
MTAPNKHRRLAGASAEIEVLRLRPQIIQGEMSAMSPLRVAPAKALAALPAAETPAG